MMTALNRTQGRAANDGGMFRELADEAILAAHPDLVARIDANTCEDVGSIDRRQQVTRIALTVLRARGEA